MPDQRDDSLLEKLFNLKGEIGKIQIGATLDEDYTMTGPILDLGKALLMSASLEKYKFAQ